MCFDWRTNERLKLSPASNSLVVERPDECCPAATVRCPSQRVTSAARSAGIPLTRLAAINTRATRTAVGLKLITRPPQLNHAEGVLSKRVTAIEISRQMAGNNGRAAEKNATVRLWRRAPGPIIKAEAGRAWRISRTRAPLIHSDRADRLPSRAYDDKLEKMSREKAGRARNGWRAERVRESIRKCRAITGSCPT